MPNWLRPAPVGRGTTRLRFDDEMTRYSLYRNFFDPYAREWQGGNSRWDLIDVVRAAYALRPDGFVWPTDDEGRVTLKLERLTAANGIDHGNAHEALSDVRATIALARLIREKQPKLYDWLFQLRGKQKVMDQIRLLQPMVHISGRFSAARNYVGVVLPLAWHPRNKNALIVCDLHLDPQGLLRSGCRHLASALVYPPRRSGRGRVAGAAQAYPHQQMPGGGAVIGTSSRRSATFGAGHGALSGARAAAK